MGFGICLGFRSLEFRVCENSFAYLSGVGINQKDLWLRHMILFFFKDLQEQVLDTLKKEKTHHFVTGLFGCRDGEIRTHDLHVPNVAR